MSKSLFCMWTFNAVSNANRGGAVESVWVSLVVEVFMSCAQVLPFSVRMFSKRNCAPWSFVMMTSSLLEKQRLASRGLSENPNSPDFDAVLQRSSDEKQILTVDTEINNTE